MTGIGIQYFLGIFFLVWSINFEGGRVSADVVKLVAGIILLVAAVIGFSPVN